MKSFQDWENDLEHQDSFSPVNWVDYAFIWGIGIGSIALIVISSLVSICLLK